MTTTQTTIETAARAAEAEAAADRAEEAAEAAASAAVAFRQAPPEPIDDTEAETKGGDDMVEIDWRARARAPYLDPAAAVAAVRALKGPHRQAEMLAGMIALASAPRGRFGLEEVSPAVRQALEGERLRLARVTAPQLCAVRDGLARGLTFDELRRYAPNEGDATLLEWLAEADRAEAANDVKSVAYSMGWRIAIR